MPLITKLLLILLKSVFIFQLFRQRSQGFTKFDHEILKCYTTLSTTHCTYSMLETVNHSNFNKSNVFVLMLYASKAFDIVNYCKLANELLKRDISPIVMRLLLYMHTSQTLRAKWGHAVSNCFTVRNGVNREAYYPLYYCYMYILIVY